MDNAQRFYASKFSRIIFIIIVSINRIAILVPIANAKVNLSVTVEHSYRRRRRDLVLMRATRPEAA